MIRVMRRRITRRGFLRRSAFGLGAAVAASIGGPLGLAARTEREFGELPRRTLGATGEQIGVLGLGGAIAVAGDRDQAARIVERALDLGVNYIDTAAQYGPSEENIGAVVRDRRSEAFLASKTHELSYDGTMRLFERSLARLQTDHLDLYQLHAVHTEENRRAVLRPDGALAAAQKLKEEGAVRYLGVTGHKNAPLFAQVLEDHPFDCVLLSINAGDRHHDSMIEHVLPVAEQLEMGVIGMKIAAYDGRIFREGGITSMAEALGYVLSYPVSAAIVGVSSVDELEQNVALASELQPFSDSELRELEERTAWYQDEVNFFKYRW